MQANFPPPSRPSVHGTMFAATGMGVVLVVYGVIIISDSLTGSHEVRLSADSKCILILAAQEADRLGHQQIGLGHFLLGMLQVEKCIAAGILQAHGATLLNVRAETVREMRRLRKQCSE